MRLVVRVKEVKGNCPVYKAGDEIIIQDGYRIDTNASTDYICMHALAALMPHYNALRFRKGADFGLAKDGDAAYVQCLDPYEYTGGGTAVFEITRED